MDHEKKLKELSDAMLTDTARPSIAAVQAILEYATSPAKEAASSGFSHVKLPAIATDHCFRPDSR